MRQKISPTDTMTDDLQHKISLWLDVPDPSTNFRAALEKRHPQTGQWLLNSSLFIDWKQSSSTCMLWLHGDGKCS